MALPSMSHEDLLPFRVEVIRDHMSGGATVWLKGRNGRHAGSIHLSERDYFDALHDPRANAWLAGMIVNTYERMAV